MRRYLKIYRAVFAINLNQFFVYRADSIWAGFFTSATWSLFNIFSIWLVTLKVNGAFGLTAGELILLSCVYNLIIGIIGMFFIKSINEFPDIVNKGKLEYFLLKPLNSQLYISTHSLEPRQIMRTLLGVIFIIAISNSYHITLEPVNVLFFAVSVVLAILLLYGCLFTLNTLVIWSPGMDNINELFYSLRSIGRYPRDIFIQVSIFMFVFFAPFVIFISTPAKILVGKASPYEFAELLILTIVTLGVSHFFWKLGLRNYTSASS